MTRSGVSLLLSCCVDIQEERDIIAARQLSKEIAKDIGFDLVERVRITNIVSELARNIYLYAGEGKLYFKRECDRGITIMACDDGPGILDIRRALEEGYSTSEGYGSGLPAVKRLVDVFDIDSMPGKGTLIRVTKWCG